MKTRSVSEAEQQIRRGPSLTLRVPISKAALKSMEGGRLAGKAENLGGFFRSGPPFAVQRARDVCQRGQQPRKNPWLFMEDVQMLVLSRRTGEEIVVDGNIRIRVNAIQGGRVIVGITAPDSVSVQRRELALGGASCPAAASASEDLLPARV